MRDKTLLDARQTMLQVNMRQKDFYESRFEAAQAGKQVAERAANAATNAWTRLRVNMQKMRKLAGIDDSLYALHQQWMGDLKEARILDLGCFAGNYLSLWMAERCAEYTGIDLSEQAIAFLNVKLDERQLAHAHAYAQDFLANSYPDNSFDLIYAYSVLHHFKDTPVILEELHRVLSPGGMVISVDPLMTEPLNRLARVLYRPFQTDRDWEWPFTHRTFRLIQNYFKIADMQGSIGMVKIGFPFQMIPGLRGLGSAIGGFGLKFDNKYARQFGLPFFLCWQCSLLLRKPDRISSAQVANLNASAEGGIT